MCFRDKWLIHCNNWVTSVIFLEGWTCFFNNPLADVYYPYYFGESRCIWIVHSNFEDMENTVQYFTGHSIQGTNLLCCALFIWETCSFERLKKVIVDIPFFICLCWKSRKVFAYSRFFIGSSIRLRNFGSLQKSFQVPSAGKL